MFLKPFLIGTRILMFKYVCMVSISFQMTIKKGVHVITSIKMRKADLRLTKKWQFFYPNFRNLCLVCMEVPNVGGKRGSISPSFWRLWLMYGRYWDLKNISLSLLQLDTSTIVYFYSGNGRIRGNSIFWRLAMSKAGSFLLEWCKL